MRNIFAFFIYFILFPITFAKSPVQYSEKVEVLSRDSSSISLKKDYLYITIYFLDDTHCIPWYLQITDLDPSKKTSPYFIYGFNEKFPIFHNVKITTVDELLLEYKYLEIYLKKCEIT